jgi:UDP-N-acetylmuramyl pentapeptide synthase
MKSSMLNLSIADLHRIIGGELQLGLMPPLAGVLEPIRRVIVDSSAARPGDVFWAIAAAGYDGACSAEEAFTRGAIGVVSSTRKVAPWAGKFSLQVADANESLRKLIEYEKARRLGRRCKPLAYHNGDTTGMIASLISGATISFDEIVQLAAQRKALVA